MLRFRLFLALLIAGSLTLPLQAATITVADDGADYTSIQAAVNAAVSGQDEVVVSPGTYLEAIYFHGKAITLRSASGDPADTIIDGGGNGSVVTCDSGETSTTVLDGFTITNGSASDGGGMKNYSSSPSVTNCTFSGNTAGDGTGGGMYNRSSSSPTVTNCILWGDLPNEIFTSSSSTLTVRFSDLRGGLPPNTVDGGGNIDVDPLFVDADGPDNTAGTEDDNLRLSSGSPCIDAGDNAAVPAGISFDLDGNSRFVDSSLSPDTGNGTAPLVDMGPYENMGLCLGDDTSGDSDGDGFCDDIDVCSGFDDNLDADGDNVPDGCDLCPGFDDNGPDSDSDGVPFGCDRCEGFDDSGPDVDNDGNPDACDDCILPGDHNCDGIVNLLDLSLLALHWLETI